MNNVHLSILGWIVLLLALYALNKTTIGHEIIYFGLVLIVLFLFIGNYNRIIPILTKST